jgi:hypothetical protein
MKVCCRWCGKARGVVYVRLTGQDHTWGVLFCPRCDYAHDHAAGPPIEHRVRDVDPKQ